MMSKTLFGASLPHTMQNLKHYLNVLLMLPRKATVLISNIISVISLHTNQPNTYHFSLQNTCYYHQQHTKWVHLPVIVEIMHQTYSSIFWVSKYHVVDSLLHRILWVKEMTFLNRGANDSSIHISLKDLALDSRTTPSMIWLIIKQSKLINSTSYACIEQIWWCV